MAQSDGGKNVASDSCRIENAGYVCGCNRDDAAETAFWEEFNSLLIQLACLIERRKLGRTVTTSDLRKAGKAALCREREI